MSIANEPLTPEMEKDIRDWLATQDALYAAGGVWHGRKQEAHHIRLAAAVAEIDRLRQRVTNLEDIETDDQDEIDRLRALKAAAEISMESAQGEVHRLREELAIVEQENREVRQGFERECDRLRAALRSISDEDRSKFEKERIARAALEGKFTASPQP